MKTKLFFAIFFCISGALFSFPFIDKSIMDSVSSFLGITLNNEFWSLGLHHFGVELLLLSSILLLSIFIKDKNKLMLIALAAIIGSFYIFLFQNAVNIPITDDYITILQFSNQYFFTDSISEKFSLFTSFHAECRLITTRIIIIMLHFITGVVNIKHLILLANCCLPVMLLFFYKVLSHVSIRLELTLMFALLLFQFGYYDSIVWATDALHYQFTIVFVMLSLYLLNKNSLVSHITSIVTGVFAALTFGNGLLIFPIAILFFIIQQNWKFVFIWTSIFAVFSLLYFQHFTSGIHGNVLFSVMDYFIYSCCFLGSAFQFMYQLQLPFFVGLLIWILFILLTIKHYYRKNYFVYGLLLCIIFSSIITAYFRLGMGLNESVSSRYGIYSVLAIVASLNALAEIIEFKKQAVFLYAGVVLCVLYHLLSGIFFFPEVPIRKQKLESFITDIRNNAPFKEVDPIISKQAESAVKTAIQKGIYFPFE
jgi:hypothetical protein